MGRLLPKPHLSNNDTLMTMAQKIWNWFKYSHPEEEANQSLAIVD
jgi:hypothetical protein